MLEETGFEIEWIKYVGYAKNPGEITRSDKEGSFFVKAIKR